MTRQKSKWWLAITVLLLVTPGVLSAHRERICDSRDHDSPRCQPVPDGGSAATYLVGAGVVCLGAMFIRSRASKPNLS